MIFLIVIGYLFAFALGWTCAGILYSRPLDEGWTTEEDLPPVEDET